MEDVLYIPPTGDLLEDLALFCDHQAKASQMTADAMARPANTADPKVAANRAEAATYAKGRRDAFRQLAGVLRDAKTEGSTQGSTQG